MQSSKEQQGGKKAFLSDQCKEIEENNRKTRDLYKKVRDTKGTFHAKMGSIKDRNSMDLTEAEAKINRGNCFGSDRCNRFKPCSQHRLHRKGPINLEKYKPDQGTI